MITKLKITNFKSHLNTELDMGALTVLTGINSSGKSSVLQSLLLLRQSFRNDNRLKAGLDLNRPLCDIGNGNDALSRFAENDIITFAIEAAEKYKWSFDLTDQSKFSSTFIPIVKDIKQPDTFAQLSLFTNDFQYLSASRWAHVNLYPTDSYAVENDRQLSREYGRGELVAHFLDYYGTREGFIQLEKVLHHNCSSKKLLDQVIAWENEVSPDITMNIKRIAESVTVRYSYGNVNDIERYYKSENVGFGLSYSLPVIVALLSATPGALLIIENPEAHLHPRGQSKMAELIALAAQSGAQVIIETHSDHIFNGIRKAVASQKVNKENVKIHFFELNENYISESTEIQLSEKGRLLNYKKGLFDQFDDDLDELLGL